MQLQVVETNLKQGEDEEQPYALTTTPWGSSPTSVEVYAYDKSDSFRDVTNIVLSGTASVSGDVISTPVVKALTMGHHYRFEIKFTTDSRMLETHFEVEAER